MSWTTWLRLWAKSVWIEVTEQPMRLVPHLRTPVRSGPVDGYRCKVCGSRSARVQDAGAKVALRRAISQAQREVQS